MDRDCDKCVYHTSGKCSQWECKGTVTIDDIKADERRKTIKDLYASDKSSTLKELLNQARADEIRKFAEWLPQHFDLRFSNNPDVWVDEFFNHTRDKTLAKYKKEKQ